VTYAYSGVGSTDIKTCKWTVIKTTFHTYTQGLWDEASLPIPGRLDKAWVWALT
jgi:hypothetical protein